MKEIESGAVEGCEQLTGFISFYSLCLRFAVPLLLPTLLLSFTGVYFCTTHARSALESSALFLY